MSYFVIETNVAITANGNKTPQADKACIISCIDMLESIKNNEKFCIDDNGFIFDEYLRARLHLSGQPGVGDMFMKWVFDYQYDHDKCERVTITPTNNLHDFEEFPNDTDLKTFDHSDRKFVAVALKSKNTPTIINAVDSDWWNHRHALKRNGVDIQFLCPHCFKRVKERSKEG